MQLQATPLTVTNEKRTTLVTKYTCTDLIIHTYNSIFTIKTFVANSNCYKFPGSEHKMLNAYIGGLNSQNE